MQRDDLSAHTSRRISLRCLLRQHSSWAREAAEAQQAPHQPMAVQKLTSNQSKCDC